MFLKEKQSQRSPHLLDAARSQILIVDVQERFGGAIADLPQVASRIALLAKAATLLKVPVTVTEQYPKGLGRTLSEVAAALPAGTPVIEKLSFSSYEAPECAARLGEGFRAERRHQIVLCGVEAHVCVLQTVCDLLSSLEVQVFVVKDAVASRRDSDRDAGFDRLVQIGAHLVTSEMVVFEWLQKAGTPEFKQMQAWVK
jgi:nicotinamidase-related amidase